MKLVIISNFLVAVAFGLNLNPCSLKRRIALGIIIAIAVVLNIIYMYKND